MNMSGKNNPNYRHGGHFDNRPEYNSWRAMRERCHNEKYWCYHRYGGRGITVYKEWDDPREGFKNFLHDMGKKPDRTFSLDRIDNDGNYEPNNCRWTSQKEQSKNSSKVINAKVTKEQLAKAVVCQCSVYERLSLGWSLEDALTLPAHYRKASRDPKTGRFTKGGEFYAEKEQEEKTETQYPDKPSF